MKCPACASPDIEREDHIEIIGKTELPYAIYWCAECGLEWKWVLGRPGIEILDGGNE